MIPEINRDKNIIIFKEVANSSSRLSTLPPEIHNLISTYLITKNYRFPSEFLVEYSNPQSPILTSVASLFTGLFKKRSMHEYRPLNNQVENNKEVFYGSVNKENLNVKPASKNYYAIDYFIKDKTALLNHIQSLFIPSLNMTFGEWATNDQRMCGEDFARTLNLPLSVFSFECREVVEESYNLIARFLDLHINFLEAYRGYDRVKSNYGGFFKEEAAKECLDDLLLPVTFLRDLNDILRNRNLVRFDSQSDCIMSLEILFKSAVVLTKDLSSCLTLNK